MRPRNRPARAAGGQPQQVSHDPFTALAFEELHRPPSHQAKDFLGGAATLAAIGAILLLVTNSLAAPCRAQPRRPADPRTCSGVSAFANHADPIVTWTVAAFFALAAGAFIWYMLWGYKAGRRTSPGAGRDPAQ